MKKLSKVEIIKETVEYYSQDISRRSYDEGKCLYLSDEGNKCAFGRILNDEGLAIAHSHEGWTAGKCLGEFSSESRIIFKKHFKEEYQYQSDETEFWNELQMFHDCEIYWKVNGLTENGEREYQRLLRKYENKN